mmetsp:Transcript_136364/g.323003  ORF Transcript_136364/g.323003 Transcript_136364/m.323003 type:complete len:218 (+) Transcript_136364:52-705(+)
MGNTNVASCHSCHQRCENVAIEYAGVDLYALTGSHPDGDLHGSEAMLTHKMLVAAKEGKEDELHQLLLHGLCVDKRRPFFMKRESEDVKPASFRPVRRQLGMSALMYAAQGGYAKCCLQLLAANADPNAEDEDGMRPLHFAATSGDMAVCEVLIQHRADVGAKADDEKTAFDLVPRDAFPSARHQQRWLELLKDPQAEDGNANPAEDAQEPADTNWG